MNEFVQMQRRVAQETDRLMRHVAGLNEQLVEMAEQRNEARAEVVRLGKELEQTIAECGCRNFRRRWIIVPIPAADEPDAATARLRAALDEERIEPDLRCPTCQSPQPSMHPAVGGGGEVTSICPDAFHGRTEGEAG